MAKHRAKKPNKPEPAQPDLHGDSSTASSLPRRKIVLFRLAALVGIPLLLLGLLELGLRLAGYGYPTAFLLPTTHDDQAVLIQNNQFGWRFFGKDVARWPSPFLIPQTKPTNSVRIFVLGESAARGEPQPDFGLPRMLQAMLSLKYPEAHFEVVNTAMTAINSHTILPIARDCAHADGDIWVIYMGNNEVVGPFGAGTVFGSQSLPLPVIRTALGLKRSRTGQLLDSIGRSIKEPSQDESLWGGMTLFLDQQVRADDPRMRAVYQNYASNLEDIIHIGQASGARIVLSTVTVNLGDCAPFASVHREDLSQSDKADWDRHYQLGSAAQQAGQHEEAAAQFTAAFEIDESFAELRFRQAQTALALGRRDEAVVQFRAARDLDTLRFRCDTRLNELIQQAAANPADTPLLLADAERVFADQSPGGVPGEDLFHEHVHLTFEGNYLLARTIAEEIVKVLPPWVATQQDVSSAWPSLADCAQRLAYTDWHRAAALNSILATVADPPFTAQLNHAAQMQRLETALARLSPARQPAALGESVRTCEDALKLAPDDPVLYKQLATLKKASGDLAGAEQAARRQLELLPNDSEGWALLGSILAQQDNLDEAAAAFRRAFEIGPQGIQSMLDLAKALALLGKQDEAATEYHRILGMKPRCVPALLQLGQLSEKTGHPDEAKTFFQQALTNRSQRLPELMELAAFFQSRRNFDAALEICGDAIRLNPSDATLQMWMGRNLASLGRYEDAAPHAAEAVRLAPERVETRLLHGIVLWRQGLVQAAMAEFEEALRLQPDSMDARLNLGMALAQQGNAAEALRYFDQVLKRNPTNAVALKYVKALRKTDNQNSIGNE